MVSITIALQDLVFDSDNILKAVIRYRNDRSRRYSTKTYYSDDQHTSRLETAVENRVGTACAVIDWKRKTFKIGTNVAGVDMMKKKSGFLSTIRHWRWLEGEEYRVRYSGDSWLVRNSKDDCVAELRSSITPIFSGESSPSVLRFSPTLSSEDERIFVLLVLLYSEAKRKDEQGWDA